MSASLLRLEQAIIESSQEDGNLNTADNWGFPAATVNDLANIPHQIAKSIENFQDDKIDEALIRAAKHIPAKIDGFIENTVTEMFDEENSQYAIPAFITTMESVRSILEPHFAWHLYNNPKATPKNISRRLESLQTELSELIIDKDELLEKITLIQNATEAAETLPTDLDKLKKARKDISELAIDASSMHGSIEKYFNESTDIFSSIQGRYVQASKLVDKCEEAYRITTTKGLAAAFDQRAIKTSNSMWVWVAFLFVALVAGSAIGYFRFEGLIELVKTNPVNWNLVWMNTGISFISLAAPVWFAWIATKQISQRFRLAEDYNFKASVAKAYEGYKKEAARLDEKFEARLFDSALTRLEEAPLRLMEKETHGSPFHELINSPHFAKAAQLVPELLDKLNDLKPNLSFKSNGNKKEKIKKEEVEERNSI